MRVEFEFEKDTPGTVRFQEIVAEGDDPVIRTLYMQKWAAKDLATAAGVDAEWPEKIAVTIDVLP